MSIDMMGNSRAPSHRKPKLPPMADIAAMLAAGDPLEEIAATYDRTPATLRMYLNRAGFSGATGYVIDRYLSDGTVQLFPFNDQPWAQDAVCAQSDPEAFFPNKGGSTQEAKKLCLTCDVRTDCLNYALDNDERFGVWGGLSERERRRIKKGQPPLEPEPSDWKVIRAWAIEQGITVAPFGRVAAPIVEAYRAAHREAS